MDYIKRVTGIDEYPLGVGVAMDKTIAMRLADQLDAIERFGEAEDKPEGARYIKMSDTLARQLSAGLRGKAPAETQTCVVCGAPVDPAIPNPAAAWVCPACEGRVPADFVK